MRAAQLDALDMQLIDLLGTDARISNRKIAAELGVTEGTVRGRIRRLQQEGLIAFTAIRGLEVTDRSRMAFVRVQAEIEHVRRIAGEIATMPEVNAVLIMMGQFNILTMCMFSELDDLFHLASDQILSIDGVHHVETSIVVRTIKYDARIARITAVQEDDAEEASNPARETA
ncbi:Lrp/AsnC family transcriptional regulator [Sphingopyxis sp. OPL5]|uniref:Lrp/AsnC family transcriptional regulator n=1 Tax=Sphingopyxis sp. OPL5 TaxID=2486273 RepID=UPI00164D6BEF|nr:Lrp/AsnC family transcriptional regulator [Sphingopyxis sp. OPL5]QNO27912.1 Lrp/AsnC family transcriptional regulator [Sphingopyxis sp. OPL5]